MKEIPDNSCCQPFAALIGQQGFRDDDALFYPPIFLILILSLLNVIYHHFFWVSIISCIILVSFIREILRTFMVGVSQQIRTTKKAIRLNVLELQKYRFLTKERKIWANTPYPCGRSSPNLDILVYLYIFYIYSTVNYISRIHALTIRKYKFTKITIVGKKDSALFLK